MTGFPGNIVEEIETALQGGMPEHNVVSRPIRRVDPNYTIGIFATDWLPDEQSIQIGDQAEPVLNRYMLRIQNLVVSADAIAGREQFSSFSKSIRVILYRDPVLNVRLRSLTEVLILSKESVKRFGVTRQRFLNNELNGNWLFVAQTDLWVETEVTKI
jgi:hypothetical protein